MKDVRQPNLEIFEMLYSMRWALSRHCLVAPEEIRSV